LGQENRELNDSITVDSLKYQTKNGRTVYGGGGITPDIHIKEDIYLTQDTQNILYSSQRWLFKYANSLKNGYAQFESFNDLNNQLKHTVCPAPEFFTWIEGQMLENEDLALEYSQDSLLMNWDLINNRIQSELAANLWGKDYRYYIRLHIDKQFQTALENFDIAKSFVE
jgi:carboxyl-terminal processing protease